MFTLNVKWEKVSNTTTANKTSKSTQHDRFTGVAGHLRLAGIPFKNTPEDFACEMFQAEVGRNKSEILRPEWGWWGRDTGKNKMKAATSKDNDVGGWERVTSSARWFEERCRYRSWVVDVSRRLSAVNMNYIHKCRYIPTHVWNVRNSLPPKIVDFCSLRSFKKTVKLVDLSSFLACF